MSIGAAAIAAVLLLVACTEHTIYAPPVEPPVAVALVETTDQDGEPVSLPYAKQPWGTTVTLDGTQSFDQMHPDYGYDWLTYEWAFSQTPSGSAVELQFPNTLEATDETDYARPTFEPDVAGTYRIELRVREPEEDLGSARAYATLAAISWQDLRFDMYWSTPATDVDLHLLAPNGEYWSDEDCYFGNPNPDWGMEASAVDNPVYGGDDDNGGDQSNPGVESISLMEPQEGTYTVIVTYHSDRHSGQKVQPWLESYVAGQDLHERIDAPETLDELEAWVAMEVEWPEMDVTVVDEILTHEELGGPPIND